MKIQENKDKKRVLVLDTSAFLSGFDSFSVYEEQVTVPMVEEEIKRKTINKVRFEAAVESGRIKIKEPSQDFESKAKAYASNIGDSYKLSTADMQLLALALELKTENYSPQIITDDYSIQNVATQMKIEFVPLATFGIKRLLEWIRYCPACHREYPIDCPFTECQVCGTKLKRKPRRTAKRARAR